MAGDNSRKGQKSKGHKNARPSQGESGSRPSVPWGHPPFYKGPPPPPPPPPSGGNDSAQQGTSSYGQHGASGYTAQSTSSDTHQDTDHETSHDAQQRAYQNDCQSSDHHIRGEPGYGWQQQSHIDVKPSTSYYAQQYYGAQAHGYGLEQGLGGDGQQETYYGTHRGTDRRAQHETSYDVPQGSGYNTPRNPQLDIGHNSSQYHQAGILASEEPNFGYSQDETGEPSVEILEGGSDAFYSSRPLGTYDSSTHDYHNSAEDQEPYDSPPDPDMKSQSSPRGQSRRKSASRSIGYGQQTPGSTANQEHMPYATTSSVDKSYRSSYDAETSQYSPDYTEHHATRPDYTSGNVYAGVPATAALHGSTDQRSSLMINKSDIFRDHHTQLRNQSMMLTTLNPKLPHKLHKLRKISPVPWFVPPQDAPY
ncbi:hypothetical protein B0T14DRAFT_491643 [Immersiella caudata]|uniref:Uncharacterized protein n=1 Tax=Immersiella caudata TaxID=314043 RepID=A0AA39XGX9_9PEZI|nr:hypothetical protein B0T14DRAFT_491643 [Immersiella caudata]